ncbi:hypothetical protein Bbelb_186180 [Branchiostoma belcheri]|nr:hypothetical protein Bbelb_186180 [Branchiostoma belcheri]
MDVDLDKVYGTIYGQCTGDAIGLLTEFMDKRRAHQYYQRPLEYDMKVSDRHRNSWRTGDWTDDSDQMILIMQALTRTQGKVSDQALRTFSGDLYTWMLDGFRELGDRGGCGLGRTTHTVLTHPEFFDNPQKAAREVWESTGQSVAPNGAVMRTSILGVHQFWDLDSVGENAKLFCQTTHADPRCVASCIAVTTAIAQMLQGETDVEKIIHNSFSRASAYLDHKKQVDELRWYMDPRQLQELQLDAPGVIGYTYKTLGAGFWALRQNDFRTAIERITMEAGDADTNAAVAGALLGCKLGMKSLPETWLKMPHKNWLDRQISKSTEGQTLNILHNVFFLGTYMLLGWWEKAAHLMEGPQGGMEKAVQLQVIIIVTKESRDTLLKPTGTLLKQPTGTLLKPTGTLLKPTGTLLKQPTGTLLKPTGTLLKTTGTLLKQPTGTLLKTTGTLLKPTDTLLKPTSTLLKQPTGTLLKPTGTLLKPTGTLLKPTGTLLKPTGTLLKPTDTQYNPLLSPLDTPHKGSTGRERVEQHMKLIWREFAMPTGALRRPEANLVAWLTVLASAFLQKNLKKSAENPQSYAEARDDQYPHRPGRSEPPPNQKPDLSHKNGDQDRFVTSYAAAYGQEKASSECKVSHAVENMVLLEVQQLLFQGIIPGTISDQLLETSRNFKEKRC